MRPRLIAVDDPQFEVFVPAFAALQ